MPAPRKKSAQHKSPRKKTVTRRRAPASRKQTKSRKKSGGTLRGRLGRAALWLSIIGFLCMATVLFIYSRIAAGYDLTDISRMPERSRVLDISGREIGSLHGENRKTVSIAKISPLFIDALLAREDSRFYDHGGVDYFGVARAAVRNIKEGEVVQGASTLTMQLARNRFGMTEKTFHRKLVEVMIARRLEAKYSKDQLLEAYANLIYYGSGIYGIERASEVYFEKHAADLNLSEAAMLAGIIRGPSPFSPFRNIDAAKAQMSEVLDRMAATGKISAEDAKKAKTAPMYIRPPERRIINETYELDIVRRELDLILEDERMAEGGLQIFTTIDLDLQRAALDALNNHLLSIENLPGYRHQKKSQFRSSSAEDKRVNPRYLQGAVVVIDNSTGGIRAIVGGRDLRDSEYNRATQAKRQIGSIFKPIVYATAFNRGLLPRQPVDDGPIQRGEIVGAGNWRPSNSDGKSLGVQAAEVGLIQSRNTMTVRVGNFAGLENIRKTADSLGLGELPNSPAVYLGTFEQTLKNIVTAYTIFPNGGFLHRPYVISEIRTKDGQTVYRSGIMGYRAVSPGAAVMTGRILEKTMDSGTGAGARSLGFRAPAAGKTGTTNDYHDAWFVGFSQSLTAGVWVGLDQNERTIHGGYGSRLALPVWTAVMKAAAAKNYPMGKLGFSGAMNKIELCGQSGLRPTKYCRQAGLVTTLEMPGELAPKETCKLRHDDRRSFLERTFSRD